MGSNTLIAITGATGLVGGMVARFLCARSANLRLVVREPRRLVDFDGLEAVQASSYGATNEMQAALHGVQTLFLVPAAETEDRVSQHMSAVDAAVRAGVERIVYLSFLGASANATFTLARDHWHTEEHIRATGVKWTFLRMNLYMDFIPTMVFPGGVIRGPAGDGRLSAILREDVAAACAIVLGETGHDGKTYDLTGRESFSLREAASLMSRQGSVVRFVDESDEEAWESRRKFGADEFEVRGWISSYQAIRDGSLSTVSLDFRRIVGRDPSTLAEYVARTPLT